MFVNVPLFSNVFDATTSLPEDATQVYTYGVGNTTLTANWVANELVFDKNQKINARGMYFCSKECISKFINLSKKKKNNINLNEEKLEEILKTIN